MKANRRRPSVVLVSSLLIFACSSLTILPVTPAPQATSTLLAWSTPHPEVNVALNKPVKVSASWVVDPPERAVNGNANDWWGAGGPAPQWIEVDLEGLYTVTRVRVINEGPTGDATYRVIGRGPDATEQLLYTFSGQKHQNQTLEFVPPKPIPDISAIRIEIMDGSGWVGFREVQVFSTEDPKPLGGAAQGNTPAFLARVTTRSLAPITAVNASLLKQLAILGRGTINEVRWSPDGSSLVIVGTMGAWLYDARSMDAQPLWLQGHARDVLGAEFSADGTTLYSGSQDGTVKTWDVKSGQLQHTSALWNDFSYEVGSQKRESEVWALAFSPDRTLLASGALDGRLRLWDLKTDTQSGALTGHTTEIADIAFSPDGRLLASSDYKGSLLLWDVATRQQLASLSGFNGLIWTMAFSPDGKTLVSGGSDHMIRIWDVATGAQASSLKGHSADVIGLAFSTDGKTLASNSTDGTLRFWDVRGGKQLPYQGSLYGATSMAFSPDGKSLATNSIFGILQLWDTRTGKPTTALLSHTSPINSIAFSPDDALVAAGGEDGLVRIWDVAANKLRGALFGDSQVMSVAFSPDGKYLIDGRRKGVVNIWDMATGKLLDTLEGHKGPVRSVAVSPDGKWIASGSTDRTVRIWNAATKKEQAVIGGHAGEVESVAFSPNSTLVVSASADKTVRISDVKTGKEILVLPGHSSYVLSAAFSPDGTRVASAGGDHFLRVWQLQAVGDALTGTNQFSPIGHGGWVLDTAFSPDGKLVASAGVSTTSYAVAPGEIHIYSADTGFPYALLRGHTRRVSSIAFSSDGKLLASGSADGSVRLWGIPEDSSQQSGAPSSPTVQSAALPPTASPTATLSPPTLTPQPSLPPPTPTALPNLPTSGNLALNRSTTSSRSEGARPSWRAVDGNTTRDWGSGDFPPQWIEIDLGAPATIQEIRLLVTQYPNGNTTHRVLVGATRGQLSEIHRFKGYTLSGQWLDFKLEQPLEGIQFVRIETLESPSWVGWVEIEVIGER